jgi:hypothetical protein
MGDFDAAQDQLAAFRKCVDVIANADVNHGQDHSGSAARDKANYGQGV